MQEDPVAAAKRTLSRTESMVTKPAARSKGQPMAAKPSPPLGSRKPKMSKRTQDIRLYAPGERDQPMNLRENIEMKQRLQSRRGNGKRGASRRA